MQFGDWQESRQQAGRSRKTFAGGIKSYRNPVQIKCLPAPFTFPWILTSGAADAAAQSSLAIFAMVERYLKSYEAA